MSVELKNITKAFGSTEVLKDVNIRIEKGEFFVLLGPSGSGKSTLLRIIAGLEEPDRGEILINGQRVNELDPSKRNIAMVFQNYALYPHMNVFNNISFPLKMRGVKKEEIISKVREVANLLNITHLLDKYPYQLSGGEQQRVALARALVRDPEVFLLDEPLSNLDAKLRVKLRFELRKLLHDQLGITTIYVTHDQIEAMTMADRIAVINKGALMQIGTPTELYEKPKNTFIATFIGTPSMNLIMARVEDNAIKVFGRRIIVRDKTRLPEGDIILGIRPQDIKVGEPSIARLKLAGEEKLGSGYILHLNFENSELLLYLERETAAVKGEFIPVLFDGPLYLFDSSTEELVTKIDNYEV